MDDLVKRLRTNIAPSLSACREAADRIEALEARITKADVLADAFEAYDNAAVDHMDFQEAVYMALAAYRADQ